MRYALLFLAALHAAFAQDVLRVTSPDGKIEVLFGIALPPEPGAFTRLAYEATYNGKPLLERSYLGFWLHDQEPILGQNQGLTRSSTATGPGYNSTTGEFLQNGSIGRRINLEVRAFNEGLAFRYFLPRSPALEDLFVDTEETQFRFPANGNVQLSDGRMMPLTKLSGLISLPLKVDQPGLGWLTLAEVRAGNYPRTSLELEEGTLLGTRLESHGDELPIVGHTPLMSSWRVVLVGPTAMDPAVAAKYLQ